MTDIYTIATKSSVYEKLLEIPVLQYTPVYQARPKMQLPLVIAKNNDPHTTKSAMEYQFLMGHWGMTNKGQPEPLASIPVHRVLKNRDHNILVRKQRCAIPANCFVVQDAINTYAVKLLKQRFFWIGGVYETWKNKRGFVFYNFAMLKTEAPDILSGICDEVPMVIPPDRYRMWLEENDPYYIMELADRSGKLWYDYFKVSTKILQPNVNDRELLRPMGSSYQELKQRAHKFESIDIEELRANSRGRK